MTTPRRARTKGMRLILAVALVASGLAVSVATLGTDAPVAQAATTCPPSPSQLDNGGFEAPVIPNNTYRQLDAAVVPGWSTTATDNKIELWSTPFGGVTAYEGRQFAELNATQASALYQDLPTTPGQTLTWSLAHRARQGTDTMRVVIGQPGAPGVENARFSDTTAGWGRHTGTYVVPANQTITRFAFEAVSTGSGNPAVGNFLDDISFGTPSCVTALKEVSPIGPRNVGDELTYSITVENDGGSATSDVVITDTLPVGVDFVAGSLLGAGSYDPSTRTVTIRPSSSPTPPVVINPGESVTVSFRVVILPTASGSTLSNAASVAATDGLGVTDTFTTNAVTTPVPVAADVQITKTFTPSSINAPTDAATMVLTVTNNGPGTAQGVTVTDVIATGLDISAPQAQCTFVNRTYACAAGSLSPGQSQVFFLAITAPTVSVATSFMNTATVSSTTYDYNPANNADIAGLTVNPPTPAALDIAKVAVLPNIYAGDADALLIGVLNTGQTAAAGVTITDTIPSGFTVTSATWENGVNTGTCTVTSTVSCTVGNLAGGATAIVTLVGTTDPGLAAGTQLTDTATATAQGTNTPTATATITVGTVADLYVRKSVGNEAYAGQTLDYMVVVENLGPSLASSVTLTDALPAGVTVIAQPQNCSGTSGSMVCALGNLDPGDIAVLDYTIEIPLGGGTLTNTATATTTTPTINPSTATDTTTTQVDPAADLQVTKSASVAEAKVGDTITYTVTVTNAGPGTATNVRVIEDLAVGAMRLLRATPSVGTVDPVAGVWNIGTLPVGQNAYIIVDGQPIYPDVAINSVFVESDQPDNFGDNNSASATVLVDDPNRLPATGGDSADLAGIGGITLILGGLMVLISRRRPVR
jgi:uncharacterized repeat protein (TIGR01451 family)/LPXTG-motif cell wall-anchored protein